MTKTKTGLARALRRNATDTERRMWRLLRGHALAAYKFHRQHPIGPYVADFACVERKLVVELDGGQHAAKQAEDEQRTESLAAHGYRVLRFWDHEVLTNAAGVLETILDALTYSMPRRHPPSNEETPSAGNKGESR